MISFLLCFEHFPAEASVTFIEIVDCMLANKAQKAKGRRLNSLNTDYVAKKEKFKNKIDYV